jgi:hypothetical protein
LHRAVDRDLDIGLQSRLGRAGAVLKLDGCRHVESMGHARAIDQRLERGAQTELVQRRGEAR